MTTLIIIAMAFALFFTSVGACIGFLAAVLFTRRRIHAPATGDDLPPAFDLDDRRGGAEFKRGYGRR